MMEGEEGMARIQKGDSRCCVRNARTYNMSVTDKQI